MGTERLCFPCETAIVGFAAEIGGMVEAHVKDDGFVGVGAKMQFLLMKPHVGGKERLSLSAFADTIDGVTIALIVVVEEFAKASFRIELEPSSGAWDSDEVRCYEIDAGDRTAVSAPDGATAAQTNVAQYGGKLLGTESQGNPRVGSLPVKLLK